MDLSTSCLVLTVANNAPFYVNYSNRIVVPFMDLNYGLWTLMVSAIVVYSGTKLLGKYYNSHIVLTHGC